MGRSRKTQVWSRSIVTLLLAIGMAVAKDSTAQETPLPDAQAYYERDLAYCNKGEFDRAIADFTRAIQLDPKNASVYGNRCPAYQRKAILIAPSPTSSRRSSSIQKMHWPTATAASLIMARAIVITPGRVLQSILFGRMISAQEAWRIGLVNEVVPAADLIPRAKAILKEIAANAAAEQGEMLHAAN